MNRGIFKYFFLFVIALSVFHCNDGDSIDPDDLVPDDTFMAIDYLQRPNPDSAQVSIGTYYITNEDVEGNTLSLKDAWQTDIEWNGDGPEVSAITHSGTGNEQIFLLIMDDSGNSGKLTSLKVEKNTSLSSRKFTKISMVPNSSKGKVYAFFIDGIGDSPQRTVEIGINGVETLAFNILPSKHVLPGTFNHKITGRDLAWETDGEAGGFSIGFNGVDRPDLIVIHAVRAQYKTLGTDCDPQFNELSWSCIMIKRVAGINFCSLPNEKNFESRVFILENN